MISILLLIEFVITLSFQFSIFTHKHTRAHPGWKKSNSHDKCVAKFGMYWNIVRLLYFSINWNRVKPFPEYDMQNKAQKNNKQKIKRETEKKWLKFAIISNQQLANITMQRVAINAIILFDFALFFVAFIRAFHVIHVNHVRFGDSFPCPPSLSLFLRLFPPILSISRFRFVRIVCVLNASTLHRHRYFHLFPIIWAMCNCIQHILRMLPVPHMHLHQRFVLAFQSFSLPPPISTVSMLPSIPIFLSPPSSRSFSRFIDAPVLTVHNRKWYGNECPFHGLNTPKYKHENEFSCCCCIADIIIFSWHLHGKHFSGIHFPFIT